MKLIEEIKRKRKEYYQKNKERIKRKRRLDYQKPPIKARAREYEQREYVKIKKKKYMKEYNKKNNERIKNNHKKYWKVYFLNNKNLWATRPIIIKNCNICKTQIKIRDKRIKLCKSCALSIANKGHKVKDTKIEIKIRGFASKLKINFIKNARIKHFFPGKKILNYEMDLYFPILKTCIECDGDYFHCNPKIYAPDYYNKRNKKIAKDIWAYDKKKKKEIEKLGIKVIRLWGEDINKLNLKTFKDVLIHQSI